MGTTARWYVMHVYSGFEKKVRQGILDTAAKLFQVSFKQETGVTLYDRDERLVIYNKASAAMNLRLDWTQAVGRTFAELSREILLASGLSAEAAESEAVKFTRDMESETGRTAKDGLG